MGFLAAAAPIIGAIGTVAGAGLGALGAINQADAAAANARYQAQVAANNQIIATQNANYATKAGEANAYTTGLKNREKAGAVIAGLASSGLDVNTGSAADVRSGEDTSLYTGVERVRQGAALTAYGYRAQATNYGAEAQLLPIEASQEQSAGLLKAGGLLFAGASSVAPKFAGLFNSANPSTDPTASYGDALLADQ